jgi:hypothetical protein
MHAASGRNGPEKVTGASGGMRLNNLVAKEEGFFAAEGLDVTLD